MQRWNCAFDGLQWLGAISLQRRYGLQESSCIRMGGRMKNIRLRADFDDASGIHDGHAIGDLRDDS